MENVFNIFFLQRRYSLTSLFYPMILKNGLLIMGKICEYIAHLDLDGRKRKPFKCMINDDNILLPFRLNLKFPVHFSPSSD